MPNYTETIIGKVTLQEKPNEDNGYFYLVNGDRGVHHVSALGGKAAERSKVGEPFTLSIRGNNFTMLYHLAKYPL